MEKLLEADALCLKREEHVRNRRAGSETITRRRSGLEPVAAGRLNRRGTGYGAARSGISHVPYDPLRIPPEKGDVDSEIRFIRGYVRLNTAESLTLESVAKRVGLSPGYLCTMFREKTGMSFRKFVEISRIEKAAYLLETEDALVADIAKRVGFCSASHFIAVFKTYYGMTPHIYRRRYRIESRPDPWDDNGLGVPVRRK